VRVSQPATLLPRVPRPPLLPAARATPPKPPPKARTITGQTAERVADRVHNKTTVPIDRFDVVSETSDPR
jgi:hypothetical protein